MPALPGPAAACGAVVVTYIPPPGLAGRLRALGPEVGPVKVVDNGPAEGRARIEKEIAGLPNTQLIGNPRNEGIAQGLNLGIEALLRDGCRWAVLLDHDSEPLPGMVAQLLAAAPAPNTPSDIAILVPRIHYDLPEIRCRWPVTRPGSRWRFRLAYAEAMTQPTEVDLAISSGMLVNLSAWPRIGAFDSGLFIDLVDTEYCLRARSRGFRVVAVPQAGLQHSLGRVKARRLLGAKVYPTHHAPFRHYYLARNRVALWRRHGARFPSWAVYELMSAVKLLVKALLYEPRRLAKLGATIRGTWDGLRGRSGPA